jgi:guanylate kinase
MLAVISGPAGSGKTTLVEELTRAHPESVRRAVTATTRLPRPGEIDGRDYHFLSRGKFEQMLSEGDFLEYNVFNGNYYGTPRQALLDDLARGGIVILVIDVNGAGAVRRFFPDAPYIFVIPPTPGELRRRLERRGTETAEDVGKRVSIAEREIDSLPKYDFLVVNAIVADAVRDIEAILRAFGSLRITGGEAEKWRAGKYAKKDRQADPQAFRTS